MTYTKQVRKILNRKLRYHARQWTWAAIDILLPPYCAGCGSINHYWCQECEDQTGYLRDDLCACCGYPSFKRLCDSCQDIPPYFTNARSLAVFRDPIRNAIHQLKYYGNAGLGDALATLLIRLIDQTGWMFDVVMPVPLGKTRYQQRGYNQAALLSRPIADCLTTPHLDKNLWRTRETRSQVELSLDERITNVREAFQAGGEEISGKSILLVDDVMTTGSTMSECARALLNSGARKVFALTLARAVYRSPYFSTA